MSQSVMDATVGIDHDAEVGRRIFHLMWDRKITQTAMAAELGVQQSALSKKLRGERRWFVADLLTVAGILDVTVSYLVGEMTESPTPKGEGPDPSHLSESNRRPIHYKSNVVQLPARRVAAVERSRLAPVTPIQATA